VKDERRADIARRIAEVPGVVGVVLGGSRATGTHTPESDHDLGLYYRRPVDLSALRALAAEVAGPQAQLTELGEWGPWVDGGGWLRIDGAAVDWLYRDLDRVRRSWQDAAEGRYAFHVQAGHPLGVADFSYAAELATAVVLADPDGELAALREPMRVYPPALSEALVAGLWEADFLAGIARKAVSRCDATYVAGCLFRLAGVCAHALHGAAGRWVLNEKGMVAAADALPGAPAGFKRRADAMFARVDGDPLHLTEAIDLAADLVLDTADACARMRR
jgi:hypothetical protein